MRKLYILPCFLILFCQFNSAGSFAAESKVPEAEKAGKKVEEADKKAGQGDRGAQEKDWDEYLATSQKLYADGHIDDSLEKLEMALATAENLKIEGSRAEAFLKIGEQYLYLRKYEKARVLMEEGLKMKRKIPGFKSLANANALDNLAQAYSRSGNLEKANELELEAIDTYDSTQKKGSADYAILLSNHANTLRQLKKYNEAEKFFAKAVSVQQSQDKDGKPDAELAKILLNAGGLYCEMNKLASAKNLLDRAEKIIQDNYKEEHPLYKLSIKSQRVYYKKLLDEYLKKNPDPVRPEIGQALLKLAALYEAEDDSAQAVAAYKEALRIEEKLLAPDSAELKKIRKDYEACEKKLEN